MLLYRHEHSIFGKTKAMADMEHEDQLTVTPAQKKLFELRMKMNAGRKANKQVGRGKRSSS